MYFKLKLYSKCIKKQAAVNGFVLFLLFCLTSISIFLNCFCTSWHSFNEGYSDKNSVSSISHNYTLTPVGNCVKISLKKGMHFSSFQKSNLISCLDNTSDGFDFQIAFDNWPDDIISTDNNRFQFFHAAQKIFISRVASLFQIITSSTSFEKLQQ